MRLIRKSFQTVSPESAKQGDYERHGWIDERGYPIEPDEYDIDYYGTENMAVIELAANYIDDDAGAVEFSSSEFGPRGWYTSIDANVNYRNGESTTYSYFLDNFTEDELRAIYHQLTGR